MHSKIIFIYCAAALASIPAVANAWSLETHLYIGAQVLDEVITDGKVSLCAGWAAKSPSPQSACARRYAVPVATREAMLTHSSAYLAGTLGPDVYPDFITSQITVHPGIEHGWGTDQWLQHLMAHAGSPEQLAWVSGFLSHASGDVFAHTWVNHYAGGIFEISEHIKSDEIELRHFILERYIADRTPRSWERYVKKPSAPHDFVADHLMLAKTVSTQYQKVAGTGHIVAIQALHESVSRIHHDARSISSKMMEIGGKELLPLEQAKIGLKIAEESLKVARQGLETSQKLLKDRDRLITDAENEISNLARLIDNNPGLITGWRAQTQFNNTLLRAQEDGLGALQNALSAASGALGVAQQAISGIDNSICGNWGLSIICDVNPAYSSAKSAINQAEKLRDAASQSLANALNLINELKHKNDELDGMIVQAENAISNAKIAQSAVGLQLEQYRIIRKAENDAVNVALKLADEAQKVTTQAQEVLNKLAKDLKPIIDLLARYDPIVLFLEHWEADIRRASMAFSEASQTVAHNILDKSDGNALEPYMNWFTCWSPVLAAVPSEVPLTVCTAKAAFEDLRDKLDSELNNAVNSLGSFGWLIAPNVKIKQELEKKVIKPLQKEVKKLVRQVSAEIITFLSNRQLADLIGHMTGKEHITDAKLNHIYETDDSKQNLLQIDDVAQRVRQDAGMANEEDVVSEDRLAPLYNAIVLSKLALLDAATLNLVYNDYARDADSQATARFLYPDPGSMPFSVLLNAVKSIDGNHQWQSVALPYATTTGADPGWPTKRMYGRPGIGSAHSGFLFWGDSHAREVVFKRIFRGPLNPGMESHPAIVANYLFPACPSHPFPSTTDASGRLIDRDLACRLSSNTFGAQGQYPALAERRVQRKDLAALSLRELRLARNEVFARHGYRFGPSMLVEHFAAQPWYKPSDQPPSAINDQLSRVEWANVTQILRLERLHRSRN